MMMMSALYETNKRSWIFVVRHIIIDSMPTWFLFILIYPLYDCIGGVMVSMLTSSAVECRFEPLLSQKYQRLHNWYFLILR
jgi:hypothetical protein